MRYFLVFIMFCLNYSAIAQSKADSAFVNHYEYLTIVVEEAGSNCNIYISKDSSFFEKNSFKNIEPFNLTVVVDILSSYNKEGWIVQNSNISIVGVSSPYRSYIYYFLSRKK